MKILAIDSSAKTVSAALLDEQKLIGEFYINTKTTHSETLMPMVDALLKNTNTNLKDIDLFAVANGPGSFTGIRIGVCAVKGMSYAVDKKCIGISTLESLAYNLIDKDCIAVAAMDARRHQVYNAIFDISSGKVNRLCEDRAISIEDLYKELSENYVNSKKTIFLVGDGADLCYNDFGDKDKCICLTSKCSRFQKASSVGLVAMKNGDNNYIKCNKLMPRYLRLSQAERELKLKKELKETLK